MKTIREMNKEELAMKFASEVVTEEQLEEIKKMIMFLELNMMIIQKIILLF